ncbi:protein of cyclin PHO80-like protein family [Rhodotorula toruloides]|nr:protein of cyclin PHO80-like protein family [Rhodotorula toruloides]
MANERFPIPATNRLATLPIETLNQIFAHALAEAVTANDSLPSKGAITRFHSKQPPPLEIGAYLSRCAPSSRSVLIRRNELTLGICLGDFPRFFARRLTKYTPFPRDAVLLGIVYLNRITHLPYTAELGIHPTPLLSVVPPRLPPPPPRQARPAVSPSSPPDRTRLAPTSPIEAPSPLPPSPTISSVDRPRVSPFLNSYTLHRLVLATLLIASKFTVDGALSQTRAAKVGGVGANELCKLEGEGLRLLGWSLMWSLVEIEGASAEIERIGEEMGVLEKLSEQRRDEEQLRTPVAPTPIPSALYTGFGAPTRPVSLADVASPPRPTIVLSPTSSSSSSSVPSSEASTSEPSSSTSSPHLFLTTHDPSIRRHQRPPTDRGFFEVPREGDDEPTPPSSPSVSSVEGHGVAAPISPTSSIGEEKPLSSKSSSETVRRFEGLSLTTE